MSARKKTGVAAMKPAQVREALERVRTMLARRIASQHIERALHEDFGVAPLIPCPASAHSNPYEDNCMQCAPRWGWIEDKSAVRS